ncbi:MAG: hypothetical protein AMJ81_12240 [Phycisphaerae bacterium SM23_33]|nr:MAG: hypothetical protein AMJ81_12240 [Phycisphaerae bacterium SM23_33]
MTVVFAWGLCQAGVSLQQVRQLRRERSDAREGPQVLYKFEDEYATATQQAARRGAEAAEAWQVFDKQAEPVAVLARSPFGGGETSASYWPAGVKSELLRKVAAPLRKRGLRVVLPELPEEQGEEKGRDDNEQAAPRKQPAKPGPKLGFSEDYEFVLVVGLHHEPIPYQSGQRAADGKTRIIRSSRVNAWAILFHAPTGSGFWAATAASRVGHGTADDPLNLAAETALGELDFSDLGADNIPAYIRKLTQREELPAVDVAALLVQTQRADAVEAVIRAAMTKAAFTDTAWVLRYFNQRGNPQDYRIDPERAQRDGCVRVSQRLTMRILLLEQLRGMRGLPPCVHTGLLPYVEDIEVQPIGAACAGQLGPLSGDDEIVLIAELANRNAWDRASAFRRNAVAAVRNLGTCRVHVDEAMAAAGIYAELPVPRPGRDGKPRPNPYREAGRAALAELAQAKIEQQRKKAIERQGP